MPDLSIDFLSLNFSNVAGHDHRIRPISARAAAIFAARLDDSYGGPSGISGPRSVGSVSAAPLNVNLATMTDEQAAQSIAKAWLDALALSLV